MMTRCAAPLLHAPSRTDDQSDALPSRSSEELFPTQKSQPPLPLPALSDTCERYLNSVTSLLSEAQLAHTHSHRGMSQRRW